MVESVATSRVGPRAGRVVRASVAMAMAVGLLVIATIGSGWETTFSGPAESVDPFTTGRPRYGGDVAAEGILLVVAAVLIGTALVVMRLRQAVGSLVLMAVLAISVVAIVAALIPEEVLGEGGLGVGAGASRADRVIARATAPTLWLVVFAAAVAAGFGLLVWWQRRGEDPAMVVADELLGQEIAAMADDLESVDDDPRRAIVSTYDALERRLSQHGIERSRAQTTAEFSSSTSRRLGVVTSPASDLAALYQDIAYGERRATRADVDRATELLRRMSAELLVRPERGGT